MLNYLSASDPVMAKLIRRFGKLNPVKPHQPDRFAEIVDSIISQQLSGKVASVIYSRLQDKCQIDPHQILNTEDRILRECGMSWAKVKYVKDLAERTANGTLQLNKLDTMSDAEVIEHLVIVKGIGPWTAEMILMFSLNRPDVFPVDDLGIQNAFVKHYGFKKDKRLKTKMLKTSQSWRPYRTLACRYLWKSLDSV